MGIPHTPLPNTPPHAMARVRKFARDPRAPKRAPSAYFLFLAKNRASIVKKVGNKGDVCGISRMAGEWWRNATDSEKAPFEKKAAVFKRKYVAARNKYVKSKHYRVYQAQ